ncbi:hypothetical protein H0H93_009894 [Arthromyces matolae]|nr:hypothetical protein H0H93_009894 [Arthromyces matolae]
MYANELHLYTATFSDQPQSYGEEVGSSEWLYEQQYTPQQNDSMGPGFYWSFPEGQEAGSNFVIRHTDASMAVVEQSVGGHSLELSFDYSDYPTSTPSSIHSPVTPTTFTSYTLADALILPPTPPRKTQIHEDTSEVRSSRDIDTAGANNFTAEPSETGRHVQLTSTDSEPLSRPPSIESFRRPRKTRRVPVPAIPYKPLRTRKKVEYVHPVAPPLSSDDTNITPPPSPKSAQLENVPCEPDLFVQLKSSDSSTTFAPPPCTGNWETNAIAATYDLQSAAVSPSSCPEPTADVPRSAPPKLTVFYFNHTGPRQSRPRYKDQDGMRIMACSDFTAGSTNAALQIRSSASPVQYTNDVMDLSDASGSEWDGDD